MSALLGAGAGGVGWLLGPAGPLHQAAMVGTARCGVDISNGRQACRLACQVHRVPVCPECWPMPPVTIRDGGRRL